ncbi:hypothetical protein EAH87_17280 [Sphingomonas koreensis]|nr:hypothetical protein EAH87_17280 [Sphingomonas koreensis]
MRRKFQRCCAIQQDFPLRKTFMPPNLFCPHAIKALIPRIVQESVALDANVLSNIAHSLKSLGKPLARG